jgi:hypothetical protein
LKQVPGLFEFLANLTHAARRKLQLARNLRSRFSAREQPSDLAFPAANPLQPFRQVNPGRGDLGGPCLPVFDEDFTPSTVAIGWTIDRVHGNPAQSLCVPRADVSLVQPSADAATAADMTNGIGSQCRGMRNIGPALIDQPNIGAESCGNYFFDKFLFGFGVQTGKRASRLPMNLREHLGEITAYWR